MVAGSKGSNRLHGCLRAPDQPDSWTTLRSGCHNESCLCANSEVTIWNVPIAAGFTRQVETSLSDNVELDLVGPAADAAPRTSQIYPLELALQRRPRSGEHSLRTHDSI